MTAKVSDLFLVRCALLKQGDMPIETYYEKIKSNCEKLEIPSEDTKHTFLHGLTDDNKIEATRLGIEQPLEILANQLEQIEKYRLQNKNKLLKIYFLLLSIFK